MDAIHLTNTTGDRRVDAAIQGTIGIFENVFPRRICSCFIEGSYADHTAVEHSDLDIVIIFRSQFVSDDERVTAERIGDACTQLSAMELDITLCDEAQLREGADPLFKLGATLVYGDDVRADIPLLPIEEWARRRMHAAYWLIIHVFKRPRPVQLPLSYPDPDAEFYGYERRTVRLMDGTDVPSTRDLIRITGWAATALVAFKTHRYVVRKRECHTAYREFINDEWSALLEQVYEKCRLEWHYRIPDETAGQRELRSMCECVLSFENHFLDAYKQFVITELDSGHLNAQMETLRFLANTALHDQDIVGCIRHLSNSVDADIRRGAHTVLAQLS